MESNKWRSNPHFVRYIRLIKRIHDEKLWDAPDEVADPVYDECDFHWQFLSEEEIAAANQFSGLLHLTREEKKDVECNE